MQYAASVQRSGGVPFTIRRCVMRLANFIYEGKEYK